MMTAARDEAGLHEFDGLVQDLSPDGVRRALGALGRGAAYRDAHDEAQVAAAEEYLRVRFGELQAHRSDPSLHVANLDPSCYDREYAPAEERQAARRAHLRGWPDAVDAAIEALDRVPAAQALAALDTAKALAVHATDGASAAALERFVAHLERASGESGLLGAAALTRLLSAYAATDVDLDRLAERADAEREIWRDRLQEACRRVDPATPVGKTLRALLEDHPAEDEVVSWAAALVDEARVWTAERGLVPHLDGECLVGPTPPTQRWQVATMTAAAPHEPDGPSWFRVSPPDPAWPRKRREQWLTNYHRSGLANIVIHEVVPGHFAHGRSRRRAPGLVRRTLSSETFSEGWAHYTEQLALEEGFRAGDPRYAASVARDVLLLRITRLACVIGLHSGAMSLDEAVHRFENDAFVPGQAAVVAAQRVMRDPLTVSYAWGRFALLDLRKRARAEWGAGFSLARFHRALMQLGSPPIGLLDAAL